MSHRTLRTSPHQSTNGWEVLQGVVAGLVVAGVVVLFLLVLGGDDSNCRFEDYDPNTGKGRRAHRESN